MDPNVSGPLRIDPDEPASAADPPADPVARRRADIDAKQAKVGELLRAMGCEAALLLLPAHVAWFTVGLNVRGLFADSERPGVYTTGQQRWLFCSNVDSQRLFDEEIDRLGFQLKEWQWDAGRADLLLSITAGRKVAADRPVPNLPPIVDRIRHLVRVLSPFEQEAYRALGRDVAHAVEATARNLDRGQSEEEVAGQLGHRLLHRGCEPVSLSVTADGRAARYRRAGATATPVGHVCTVQATGQRDGLFVTAGRTVSFGPPAAGFRAEYELAFRLAAVYRLLSVPGESIGSAGLAGRAVLANTAYEYDWRLSQPGYGAGRFPAEELRRAGQDEPFADGQAVVWQPRVGSAAVVDTVVVTADGPAVVTPPDGWPFARVTVQGRAFDVPTILVRDR